MLLELPAELRLEIWKLALTPAPRALTYRRHRYDGYTSMISGLSSMQLGDISRRPTYTDPREAYEDPLKLFTDPSQVKYLCKQIFSESKDVPLSLNSVTFSSSSRKDTRLAMRHFECFLASSRLTNMWASIRFVTIRCENLRGAVEKINSDDPDSQLVEPKDIFLARLTGFRARLFLRNHPKATVRFCVPELSKEQPVRRRMAVVWWILTRTRCGRHIPDPIQDISSGRPRWETPRLQNIKFVSPDGEIFEKEELRSFLSGRPQATIDFWMAEAESWGENGI